MYYCIEIFCCHVYYSKVLADVEAFRDKHSPESNIWETEYPHTYGFAHRIPRRRT